jgi:hypothetical protein
LQLGKCVVLTLIATVLICNVVVLANIGVVLTLIATGGEGWRTGKGWFSCPLGAFVERLFLHLTGVVKFEGGSSRVPG